MATTIKLSFVVFHSAVREQSSQLLLQYGYFGTGPLIFVPRGLLVYIHS